MKAGRPKQAMTKMNVPAKKTPKAAAGYAAGGAAKVRKGFPMTEKMPKK